MKLFTCDKCGSSDYIERNGQRICSYCRSKYAMQTDDFLPSNSTIALDDDVSILLQKCRADPTNARRYAELILDIDPGNAEARKYLR